MSSHSPTKRFRLRGAKFAAERIGVNRIRYRPMKRILLAFDKFKGSLHSDEVADAFAHGIRDVVPHCEIRRMAIADGGEGTAETLRRELGAERVSLTVSDPLRRPIEAHYAISGSTAIIEMAAASGLTLLSSDERNPLKTTTYGTGEMVADAIARGCRHIVLGIGGSATNDGGMGMLKALGCRFLNAAGESLSSCGESLEQIATIDSSTLLPQLADTRITIACDVDNPLTGVCGAAHIYAPQKGADEAMVVCLDRGLEHFADIVLRTTGVAIKDMAGAGAAGGMGGGCHALLGARLLRGIDVILELLHFDERAEGCDLIITGEGRIDTQTLRGKAPHGILRHAQRLGIPVIAVGGSVELSEELRNSGFRAIYAATPDTMSLDEAMRHDTAERNLRHTAQRIAQEWLVG